MSITIVDFVACLKPGGFHQNGMHIIPTVHTIAQKYYCDTLTARSLCSGKCRECIENIRQRLNRTDKDAWKANGKNPYALYTFIVKEVAAKVIETQHTEDKSAPKLTELGERNDSDALELFMETINDSMD